MFRSNSISFLTGFILWSLGGTMNTLIWIPPTPMFFHYQIILTFAISGGIIGILIFRIYKSRPEHEHQKLVSRIDGAPRGPKTFAEGKAGLLGDLFGILGSLLIVLFLLPILINGPINKISAIRIIATIILNFGITSPILPFTLKILNRFQ
jgi:hypothetical protein